MSIQWNNCTIELQSPTNGRLSLEITFLSRLHAEIYISTSGLQAAILNFRTPLYRVQWTLVPELLECENGGAVTNALLSAIEAEICNI